MLYEWNEKKREKNAATHGVDFSAIESFVWEKAVVLSDTRKSYGEPRFVAYGPIEGRLHCAVFTVRKGIIRLISLRKANSREVKRYGYKTESTHQG